jgi:copper chaperone CopZ
MKQIIEVENIKCGGCANSIKSALLKLEHVEQVEVDIENEQITVHGDFDKLVITNKLDELGYPEKGHNSIIKKAKSYVNCAIGKMS